MQDQIPEDASIFQNQPPDWKDKSFAEIYLEGYQPGRNPESIITEQALQSLLEGLPEKTVDTSLKKKALNFIKKTRETLKAIPKAAAVVEMGLGLGFLKGGVKYRAELGSQTAKDLKTVGRGFVLRGLASMENTEMLNHVEATELLNQIADIFPAEPIEFPNSIGGLQTLSGWRNRSEASTPATSTPLVKSNSRPIK